MLRRRWITFPYVKPFRIEKVQYGKDVPNNSHTDLILYCDGHFSNPFYPDTGAFEGAFSMSQGVETVDERIMIEVAKGHLNDG